MDFFITRCPQCQTAYKTTPSQLAAANGRLRCGECGAVFTADDNRQDEPLTATRSDARNLAVDGPPVRRSNRRKRPLSRLKLPGVLLRGEQQPLLQAATIVVLLLTLTLQYLWHNRLVLAQDPERRSWASLTCSILPCQLPPLQAVDLLQGENLMIRSHPERPEALRLTLGIHNRAGFEQPLPLLALTFRDRTTATVAMAHFTPAQ